MKPAPADLAKPSFILAMLLGALLVSVSCTEKDLTDIDGNRYRTVKIGSQTWMSENLRVTHFRNGDSIPLVDDNAVWENATAGAACRYDNSDGLANTYGLLYNWFAVSDPRQIAPGGWHVPTDQEWQVLIDYLGGDSLAGGKLKEGGAAHWLAPNTGATNESGFTARPAGDRSGTGHYFDINDLAYFLSTTVDSAERVFVRGLSFDSGAIRRYRSDKVDGLSVRCVKD